jgi:predicted metal-dependent hydrolase
MIPYTLTRSNRRTVALYVRGAQVEVRAPLGYPQRQIDALLQARAGWIEQRLAAQRTAQAERAAYTVAYGDLVAYRGRTYPITARPGNRVGFDGQQFFMPGGLDEAQIRRACVQIYRLAGRRDLTAKALDLGERLSVRPSAVKVTGARTRWASCSTSRSLNFSWRLMLAADDLIDYVVVHELAHIHHPDHSPAFWAQVAQIVPDHRQRVARLKDHSRLLDAQGWQEF